LIIAALMRIIALTATNAMNSVVFNASLVCVDRRASERVVVAALRLGVAAMEHPS
jgi:hypothetical protein